MGPTLNEISFSILDVIRPRAGTNDPISLDLIKFHIHNTRAMLIKQDLNKGYSPDPDIVQDLECVDMELVDRAECCSTNVNALFVRSKLQLPRFIELHHKQMIMRAGPVDKIAKNYDIITYSRVPFEGLNRFTKGLIKAFTMNNGGYLYLMIHPDNKKGFSIEKINVQGVFENPVEASKFLTCTNKPCYTDDSAYPIKSWMLNPIKDIIIKNYVGIQNRTGIDDSNNLKSDPKPQASAGTK